MLFPFRKSAQSNSNFQPITHRSQKWKYVAAVVPLVFVLVATFLGITQLDKIRQFFGQASGENANIVIDTQAVLGSMPRPWRNFAQGGEQFDWRMQPILGAVRSLHPQYIRLDHIYDFYDIVHGSPGHLTFDFSKFDAILDDIQAAGAKPYIALSYMPPAISKSDMLGLPVNWSDWQLVVQKTIEHVSGTRRTPDVYYEVWNEPDLFGGFHYYGSKNYLTLYEYAAAGAANARGVMPFKIGGPAITALYKEWFDALLKDVIAKHLRLDFFSWHRYSTDINQYKTDMANVKNWVQLYPQLEPTLEFHITEWGHDSNNNAGYDGMYGAAQTVAGSIEMINVVDHAFVFELQDGKDPAGQTYWGRWGLFTSQDSGSKAKPRYSALKMLDRIANQRLQLLGKGTWVKAVAAKSDTGSTQIVVANYDPRGSHAENVPITLQNITPGSYLVHEEFLGGRQQSVQVATSEAALQFHVALSANSVGFIEVSQQ